MNLKGNIEIIVHLEKFKNILLIAAQPYFLKL
jgi:hypothetical protein